jgi:hypothetical protein
MERSVRRAIATRDRFTCQSCGRRTRGQVHHILPRGQGGPDLPANLVTLCGRCHMLVSPIPLHVLRRVLRIDVEEILVQKARVEVAIHSWVLSQAAKSATAESRVVNELGPRLGPSARPLAQPARSVPEWKRLRPRAGKPWTTDEDGLLLQEFDAGLPLEEIAHRRGRGVFAVEVRLFKLGRDTTARSVVRA